MIKYIYIANRLFYGGKKMERIISEIKDTADKVVKKSGELFELSKLKINISSTKSEISANYKILGELVYLMQKEETPTNTLEFDEIIAKIDELNEKLTELLDLSSALKNEKNCPKCSKSNNKNAQFCSNCGYKFSEASVDEDDFVVED